MNSKNIVRILTIIVILVVAYLASMSPFAQQLTLEGLQQNSQMLRDTVEQHSTLYALFYLFIYFVAVTLSIPGAGILSLAGGFLFGWAAAPLILVGATSGAVVNFLLAKYLLGASLQKRYSKELSSFNNELEKYGANYLLSLRLIPAFPFFLINLLAGLTSIKVSVFAFTTAIGIIPGILAYTFAGQQLGEIETTADILSPGLISAFVILGLLSLVPSIFRKRNSKDKSGV